METSDFEIPERARRLVAASADPDMALRNLERYVSAADALPSDLTAAVALFAGSQSFSTASIRDPALLERVLSDPELPDPVSLAARSDGALKADPSDPRRPLRRMTAKD